MDPVIETARLVLDATADHCYYDTDADVVFAAISNLAKQYVVRYHGDTLEGLLQGLNKDLHYLDEPTHTFSFDAAQKGRRCSCGGRLFVTWEPDEPGLTDPRDYVPLVHCAVLDADNDPD